jgi:hypothetical protein
VTLIAQKRGFIVYQCLTSEIPARPFRVKLDGQLTDYSKSHLLVFGDEGETQQEWLWLKPELGKSAKVRSHSYKVSSDLAPFAFTVRARSARTVNAGFGGAKHRRNPLIENGARSESVKILKRCCKS